MGRGMSAEVRRTAREALDGWMQERIRVPRFKKNERTHVERNVESTRMLAPSARSFPD